MGVPRLARALRPTSLLGPMACLRFHGAGERYGGTYAPQRLAAWADRIAGWAADGTPVWAFFNNDIGGHAMVDAARLREYVARRIGGGDRLAAQRHANCIRAPT